MVISFLSLGGIRQFSQGLYGMSRSFTACFSAACSTAWTRRTKVLDRGLSFCFDPRCILPFSFRSLYILWMWMDESCLSLIVPMAGMMWCSMIPS